MPRSRYLKPGFFSSRQVLALTLPARLTFLGLLPWCDDQGIHPLDVAAVHRQAWAGDPQVDPALVLDWLGELVRGGLVLPYTGHDGQAYLLVTGWYRHQRPTRPTSKYPLPSKSGQDAMGYEQFNDASVKTLPEARPIERFSGTAPIESTGCAGISDSVNREIPIPPETTVSTPKPPNGTGTYAGFSDSLSFLTGNSPPHPPTPHPLLPPCRSPLPPLSAPQAPRSIPDAGEVQHQLDLQTRAAARTAPTPKASTAHGTRLPEDWELPAAWVDDAVKLGLDQRTAWREADRFKDHWHGKAGANARKANWRATWRNWCRRAIDDRGPGRGGNGYAARGSSSAVGRVRAAQANGQRGGSGRTIDGELDLGDT